MQTSLLKLGLRDLWLTCLPPTNHSMEGLARWACSFCNTLPPSVNFKGLNLDLVFYWDACVLSTQLSATWLLWFSVARARTAGAPLNTSCCFKQVDQGVRPCILRPRLQEDLFAG